MPQTSGFPKPLLPAYLVVEAESSNGIQERVIGGRNDSTVRQALIATGPKVAQ